MNTTLLTPEEAIRFLALDKQELRSPRESLRWLCRSKKLRYTKVGRYIRFRQAWLDELVERHSSEMISRIHGKDELAI